MNIESAKIAIDKMASFLPEHVLNDLYKDHDAVAHIISKETDKLVFSVVFNNGEKRILTITVKRHEVNVHYNGTMQVFSKLITVEFFNDVLKVLFPEVKIEKVNATMKNLNDLKNKSKAMQNSFMSQHKELVESGKMSVTDFAIMTGDLVKAIVSLEKVIKELSTDMYTFNPDGTVSVTYLSHFTGGKFHHDLSYKTVDFSFTDCLINLKGLNISKHVLLSLV